MEEQKPAKAHMVPGSHLKSPRYLYSHHGISTGEGTVIEYDRTHGIREVTIAEFERGSSGQTEVIPHPEALYVGSEAVRRARSRLGERHYDLRYNNCEQFANWCIDNAHVSEQVERATRVSEGLGIAAAVGAAALSVLCFLRLAPRRGPGPSQDGGSN
ncbi:MAG: lecithin retinol acyltransferase family protein [Succinivibrionaceae bacterium]|nr:lecithin retinol acyltransferase family protein [Succinivibrionaceae bacterium]